MNIIIVDDEILVCDAIEQFVKKYYENDNRNHNVNIVKFYNECQLFDYIDGGKKADIVFMDIKLKRLNGIDIAAKLQRIDKSLRVVFITGYIEYAKQIFKANPSYFLVKPINQKDIDEVLDKMELDYIEAKRDTLSFKSDQVVHCVNKKDIYYIEAEGRNIKIVTREKQYKINAKISDIYNEVKDNMEMCHRSYIVNLDKIDEINKYEVVLISGKTIPLSRRRKDELRKRVTM